MSESFYKPVSDSDRELIDRIADEVITGPPADIPAAGQTDYQEYIASPTWAHVRDLALEYYAYRCCLCNSTKRLNVHHRTYARLGRERLGDLTVLCRKCHSTFHKRAA